MFHAYPPTHNAGAEWMTHTMLRHLVDNGHHVEVLLSQPAAASDDYEFEGVNVSAWRGKGDPIERMAATPRPDVIITHLENTPRASILAGQAKIPTVHILHNTFLPTKKWARDFPPALMVANSQWMRDDYAEHFAAIRRPLPTTVVIRPPVTPTDYATTPGTNVTLVNLYANKGPHVLWALAERMPHVGFLAVMGGYGPQQIPDVVPPNVEIVPNTPHMRDEVYARTRILLMPSDYESWGRVGVEAMCSGIPVVAHPTTGLRESLGGAGTFVDRQDLPGWETAVAGLLKPRAWGRASKLAKARAAELDPAPDLERWLSTLTEAINPRRR